MTKAGLTKDVETLLQLCRERGVKLATAESCTAGAIAAAIASVSGASDVLDRGWIVYSNLAKQEEISVDPVLIDRFGAVSREVVESMSKAGAQKDCVCVAVSGIAGPTGGSKEKPVGLVWIAVSGPGIQTMSERHLFSGSRNTIQHAAVDAAISMLIRALSI